MCTVCTFGQTKKKCAKWATLLSDDGIEFEKLVMGLGLCLFRVNVVLVKVLHHLVGQGDQGEKTHAAQKNWVRVRYSLFVLRFYTFVYFVSFLSFSCSQCVAPCLFSSFFCFVFLLFF